MSMPMMSPVFQHLFGAGDAVADDVVDGDADRRGERVGDTSRAIRHGAVALVHRQRAALADELFGDVVEFRGPDARHDVGANAS